MQQNKKNHILITCLLLTVFSFSQNNKQIRAYNLADGLPQSQVYDMLQDNYGYLWLGTQGGGIARFDGDEFKIWNEKKDLLSNYIHSLNYKNDSLYIGTKYGLSIKIKDHFINYKSPQINKIVTFNNNYLLATTKGCYLFKNNSIVKLNINKSINNTIVNDIIYNNHWFYIATSNGLFKASKDFLEVISLSNYDFKSVKTYEDLVFAASYSHGVFVYDEQNRFQIIDYTKRINSINILNKKELWIATDNAGVKIINANNYEFIQRIDKKNGLPIANIIKSIKDKQANIWLASSGGFYKIFNNNFIHFNKNNGLKGNSVYAIHQYNKAIYLSNADEGLFKIDSLGIQPFKQDHGFLNVKVKALAHDSHHNLYAGTNGKGVLIMHDAKKDSIAFHLDEQNFIVHDTVKVNYQFIDTLNTSNGLPFNWIKKIHIKNDIVWLASHSNGIAKFEYDTNEKEFKNIKHFSKKQGLKDVSISDITSDNKGSIWYATKNGHIGTIHNNKVHDLGNILQKNTAIRTLLFHNEQLFIATSNQGVWWSNLTIPLKFNQLIGKKELYSNNIYQLIFDAKNQLWAGSENGVDKINLDKNNTIIDVQHFGRNDGFLGIETCQNAIIKDDENNLWFGTINGLTKYQPSNNKLQLKKPTLFFENIEVMNESLDTIQLQNFINEKKVLKLKSNQNLLAFYFKTVDINHPKELEYRWKLDNYKWSNWNKDTKVNIASDYGKHSIKAQSRDLNWILSDVVNFQFERKMPLFKKPWFIWTAASVLGLLLIGLTYWYFLRLKRRNQLEKERLQLENNLLSLEQKALRLQMNPHFIFNVLNGIKAMSINDVKTMHKTINKFATLLRATLTNSRKDNITLSEEINTLKNYIEVEQLMSEKAFTYQINLKTEMDSEEILIPPMLIQPFVENAIRHGIMAVKRDGELNIEFLTKNDFLFCTIIDNGIGIQKSKENKPKSNHQSMALEVTKERIEHLAGKNTLVITEVADKNNKLAGTKVRFKIPLITDY